ncbi:MAG: hypothetical protein SGJ21_17065 [Alphaproteobacteria bacterium]|nr:hypothetical protein [Alphaproteobacteria bacterium]
MSWLAIHMWVELLVAAGFGGLIGWALHARSRRIAISAADGFDAPVISEDHVRITELETQVRQERDEVASLRAKAIVGADEEGSPAWRNRHLESRVRFLEGKLADAEAASAPSAPLEDQNDEPTRLRWRNRYLEGRVKYLEEELMRSGHFSDTPVVTPAVTETRAVAPAALIAGKPLTLDGPRGGQADNLKQITGVGPKLEKLLNGLGVYHFDQIASWSQEQVDWVNAAISFRGRIERERWVSQASGLMQPAVGEGKQILPQGQQT